MIINEVMGKERRNQKSYNPRIVTSTTYKELNACEETFVIIETFQPTLLSPYQLDRDSEINL